MTVCIVIDNEDDHDNDNRSSNNSYNNNDSNHNNDSNNNNNNNYNAITIVIVIQIVRHWAAGGCAAAQKATVRDVSLARLPSGPLNASPRRPADVLVLPEDAPEEELQEAIVKAQPRLRLQKTKVHDDPVGLLPPSPQDVESIAEQLKKNRRFLTPGSSPAGSGDLKSSDVAQEDPSTGRGLGLIMRKVQVRNSPSLCC